MHNKCISFAHLADAFDCVEMGPWRSTPAIETSLCVRGDRAGNVAHDLLHGRAQCLQRERGGQLISQHSVGLLSKAEQNRICEQAQPPQGSSEVRGKTIVARSDENGKTYLGMREEVLVALHPIVAGSEGVEGNRGGWAWTKASRLVRAKHLAMNCAKVCQSTRRGSSHLSSKLTCCI